MRRPYARSQRQPQTLPGRSLSPSVESGQLVSESSQDPDSGSAKIRSLLWPQAVAPTRSAAQSQASPAVTHLRFSSALRSHGGDTREPPRQLTDYALPSGIQLPPRGAAPAEEASIPRISDTGWSELRHSSRRGLSPPGAPTRCGAPHCCHWVQRPVVPFLQYLAEVSR
ncbi:hypothetical protein NDU88_007215 [Pleurodeles waltl]|uniref:Uncharacterized protein n=1 Tax=Pleurodeles waltl TaxID=8319 RepID=A0AAV7UN79_PLEWA|nr:hypothetical protein NDU88_007215 [Pleurodeles waltl]